MLVISNNCAGAELYKKLGVEFNNPFMWSLVFADDMINIIRDFTKINWAKIKPIFMDKTIAAENSYWEYTDYIPGFNIDNRFNIYYPHYKMDINKQTPEVCGIDVYYRYNYKYAYDKYASRLKRFCNVNELPAFLILTYKRHGWTDEKVQRLAELDTPYLMSIITSANITSANRIVHVNNLDSGDNLGPGIIINRNYDSIYSNLGIKPI